MIALDTNIIIALLVSSAEGHVEVSKGLETLDDILAITHVNIGETLRLLTHPKVFRKPLSMPKAVDVISEFIDINDVQVLSPSDRWLEELKELSNREIPDMRGNDVFDAQIALCLKYNGVNRIWTKDSDFRKYSFLQVISPLYTATK